MNFDLSNFADCKKLVRLSPFFVATYMGKADELHLEEEKVVELSHFEEFSLNSEENSSAADIFLNLEEEDFHEIWELEQSEILSLLHNLPRASHIVLGINSGNLSAMLNRLAVQVAEADGLVHDLELAAAHELELVLEDLYALEDLDRDLTELSYDQNTDFPHGLENQVEIAKDENRRDQEFKEDNL
tara:strand:- start:51 stop:611 length:561 start_codon:yes stop_codon:yes gene_type:complete